LQLISKKERTDTGKPGRSRDGGGSPHQETLLSGSEAAVFDISSKRSEALTRCVATSLSVSVAIFTSIFAIAVIFGWIGLEASMIVVLLASSCVLVCALLLGVIRLRGVLRCLHRSPS